MKHLPVRERKETRGCIPVAVEKCDKKIEIFGARGVLPQRACSLIVALQIILYVSFPARGQEAPVQLRLEAEKQVLVKNQQGEERVSWQSLAGNTTVQPGDVIRYVLRSANNSDADVKNFVLTQPIPQKTVYVLDSAAGSRARITYSIDGGKTFTANPTIEVIRTDGTVEKKPAPASRYTHIRWTFEGAIAPSALQASYQVKVR